MTIHELLQAAGLTANDEIPIWDADGTGEPTKKITAQQLAAAVVALANLVTSVNNQTGAVSITPANIGAVAKSGDTMTGPLTLDNTDRASRAIHFKINGSEVGWIGIDDSGLNQNVIQLVQINPNVAGAFGLYQFPAADENSPGFYYILTTKSPVLVTQGGTGATTILGALQNLFDVDGGAITQYPNKPGIYWTTSNVFAHMTPSSVFGVLMIIKSGYGMHLYLDYNSNLYIGFSGNVFDEPSTWRIVTSTIQS